MANCKLDALLHQLEQKCLAQPDRPPTDFLTTPITTPLERLKAIGRDPDHKRLNRQSLTIYHFRHELCPLTAEELTPEQRVRIVSRCREIERKCQSKGGALYVLQRIREINTAPVKLAG